MRLALRLHPDSPRLPATHIDVDLARPRAGSLVLSYVVTGTINLNDHIYMRPRLSETITRVNS